MAPTQRLLSELNKSQERLELALEASQMGMWDWEITENKLVWSDQLQRIYGLTPGSFRGTYEHYQEMLHPDDREQMGKTIQQALANRQPYIIEHRIIRPDGTIAWVQGRGRAWFDEQGNPIRMSGTSVDITESKRQTDAQNVLARVSGALHESMDYRTTLRQVAELLVPTLADWCIISLTTDSGSLKRHAIVHHRPEKLPLARELESLDLDEEGSTAAIEFLSSGRSMMRDRQGGELPLLKIRDPRQVELIDQLGFHSCIATPIMARGRVLGAINLVVSDKARSYRPSDLAMLEELARRVAYAIDNAKLYESMVQALRIRDEFLSICSHELKTPLTSIKLQIDLRRRALDRGETGPESLDRARRSLATEARQIDRLDRLVTEMLDISRIEAGKLEIRREPTDLVALVNEVLERLSAQLAESRCKVALHAPRSAIGNWDRDRIEQVITNLMTNAMKYGDGSPIDVTLEQSDGSVTLSVHDHGPGISAEDQARVFGRFERGSARTEVGGLGLGLYIVKQIVQLHGGQVSLKSARGEGARFSVELPT